MHSMIFMLLQKEFDDKNRNSKGEKKMKSPKKPQLAGYYAQKLSTGMCKHDKQ